MDQPRLGFGGGALLLVANGSLSAQPLHYLARGQFLAAFSSGDRGALCLDPCRGADRCGARNQQGGLRQKASMLMIRGPPGRATCWRSSPAWRSRPMTIVRKSTAVIAEPGGAWGGSSPNRAFCAGRRPARGEA
jgi:hypothetical protein